MCSKLPYVGGRNGDDTHDTSRSHNNTKSFNSPYRKKNVGHRWRRFYMWTLWLCNLGGFRSLTVSGNPLYECRICENNNDLPFAVSDRRYWSSQ
jgi:hypothetical protein